MSITTFAEETFPEEGSRTIKIDFEDEDGDSVTPNTGTIQYTLTNKPDSFDTTPTVINSRENVDVASASTIYITLSGDDLALLSTETDEAFVERVLLLEYEYNSSYGNNLKAKAQYIFTIENLYSV